MLNGKSGFSMLACVLVFAGDEGEEQTPDAARSHARERHWLIGTANAWCEAVAVLPVQRINHQISTATRTRNSPSAAANPHTSQVRLRNAWVRAVHRLLLRSQPHVMEAGGGASGLDRRNREDAHAPRPVPTAQAGDAHLRPRRVGLGRRAVHPRRCFKDERGALPVPRPQLGHADSNRRRLGGNGPVLPRLRAPVGEAVVGHDARQPRRSVGELYPGLHPRRLVDDHHDACLVELRAGCQRERDCERCLCIGVNRCEQRLSIMLHQQRLVEGATPIIEARRWHNHERAACVDRVLRLAVAP
mmetsp:Transcript_131306/g.408312  ORF Transcript_131306/g.408312 Transcript_131306/m.408312 type:complete len:302 (+) Transcript_131306:133-1038(+)